MAGVFPFNERIRQLWSATVLPTVADDEAGVVDRVLDIMEGSVFSGLNDYASAITGKTQLPNAIELLLEASKLHSSSSCFVGILDFLEKLDSDGVEYVYRGIQLYHKKRLVFVT